MPVPWRPLIGRDPRCRFTQSRTSIPNPFTYLLSASGRRRSGARYARRARSKDDRDEPGVSDAQRARGVCGYYSQSVFTFNEHFALTLGARWARDQLHGEENPASTAKRSRVLAAIPAFAVNGPNCGPTVTTGLPECGPSVVSFVSNLGNVAIPLVPDAVLGAPPGAAAAFCNAGAPTNPALIALYAACIPSLKNVNAAIGALNPTTGQVLDYNKLLTTGVPVYAVAVAAVVS